MYLMFVTFPTLFSGTYGWSAGVDGLVGPSLHLICRLMD